MVVRAVVIGVGIVVVVWASSATPLGTPTPKAVKHAY